MVLKVAVFKLALEVLALCFKVKDVGHFLSDKKEVKITFGSTLIVSSRSLIFEEIILFRTLLFLSHIMTSRSFPSRSCLRSSENWASSS